MFLALIHLCSALALLVHPATRFIPLLRWGPWLFIRFHSSLTKLRHCVRSSDLVLVPSFGRYSRFPPECISGS